MKVTISGGNVGNLSEGNHNTLSAKISTRGPEIERAFAEFFGKIDDKEKTSPGLKNSAQALRDEVTQLKTETRDQPNGSSFSDKIKSLYDKYGWAADALAKLASAFVK